MTALSKNLRSHTTARVGAAVLNEFRCGAYFGDVVAAAGTMRINQYVWLMTEGVKILDNPDEDSWTEVQR